MDSLVEAITELVMKELEAARAGGQANPASTVAEPVRPVAGAKGPRVLVVPGQETVEEAAWSSLAGAAVKPSLLHWEDAASPGSAASSWPKDSRGKGWSKAVTDYGAVVLLGTDLPTLGSLATLGSGGQLPAVVAVAAVAAGVPVFCETSVYERVRRHSARLAPGFTRAFEDHWRTVAGFGIELGTAAQLESFLSRLGGATSAPAALSKGGGRDVVTAEDVEAVRRSGQTQLLVGIGSIVTPLALQQASEWGIEVKFQ